uniref:Uncharacterized protein n=1 Tax=Apteryx owenii TaxID=8824 RepID=A0A8B9S6J3_APTOW
MCFVEKPVISNCSEARLELTRSHLSPLFPSTQSWMKRTLPFSTKMQLPSSFPLLPCLQCTCSFIMMTCLTTAICPCALGDPSWAKDALSLFPRRAVQPECCQPQEKAGTAVPARFRYSRVINGLFCLPPSSSVSLSWFFTVSKTERPTTPLKLHPCSTERLRGSRDKLWDILQECPSPNHLLLSRTSVSRGMKAMCIYQYFACTGSEPGGTAGIEEESE